MGTEDVSAGEHADPVDDLISQGRDTASRVLARAATAHLKHRVLMTGHRMIVFR